MSKKGSKISNAALAEVALEAYLHIFTTRVLPQRRS
jgi:hypothetical protein